MKFAYGSSKTGNVAEALKNITVIAMKEDIKAAANVLEQASVMPVKYIRRLENAVKAVGGERGKTACFDICSAGADVRAVTTLSDYLCRAGYDLAGGTSNSSSVACNGKIYKDACAFFIFKNLRGKIKSYKENIYVRPQESQSSELNKFIQASDEAMLCNIKSMEKTGRYFDDVKRSVSGTTAVREAIEGAVERNRASVRNVQDSLGATAGVYSDIIDRMDIDDSKKGVLIEAFQNIIEQAIAMVKELP